MAAGSKQHLLDLPPELLARIGALLPFAERLQLSLVCRRWRDVCAGPSELWSGVEARMRHGPVTHTQGPFTPGFPEFARWFTRRAQAVEELRLEVVRPEGAPDDGPMRGEALAVPAALLHDGSRPRAPLPLRKLALDYRGGAFLDFSGGGSAEPAAWLPQLQKVALFLDVLMPAPPKARRHGAPQAPPRLTDLSLIGGSPAALRGSHGWLPPCLTALVISSAHLGQLPRLLTTLKHLRSLVLDKNHLGRLPPAQGVDGLPLLAHLGQLEELNLSANPLGRPPAQLTALRHLRILYLHGTVSSDASLPPEAWEPLRALTALAFLSISANGLQQLPPAVADMAHLQALHCEENNLPALPTAPYLSSLRELLVDWRTLMAGPASLAAAPQLTRLILHRFQPALPPTLAGGGGAQGPPPGGGEALLAELAALPRLQRVEDVYEGGSTHLVTAEMAHVMWQLGRRCPHLELWQPRSTNLGWTLSCLVAQLPHNAGTAVLGP